MKHQTYLCVDLRTRMQEEDLHEMQSRKGILTMTQEGERFEFDEVVPTKQHRHPKLWSGHRLNVKYNPNLGLLVHFRRLGMTRQLNPAKIAMEIKHELQIAKQELGLQ